MKRFAEIDWRSYEAEAHASNYRASETCYGEAENIGIVTVVIPELGLGNIQRQVLGRDLVEAANDGSLKQGPEAFNRL